MFQLEIPINNAFIGMLIEKIEDFISLLLVNLTTIHRSTYWDLLVLVIVIACARKILGMFFVAISLKVPSCDKMTPRTQYTPNDQRS